MSINWFVVLILILISLGVLLRRNFKYIDAFIFFIPFNATVVFFTPDNTPINLPFILFFFASISYFLRRIFNYKFLISKDKGIIYTWLIVIGLIAIFSQFMPFIINGNYRVLDRYTTDIYWATEEALYPSFQWITQTIYLFIGLLVVFIISSTYKTLKQVKKMLKLLISGITFMIFWGWLGDITFFLNIPYPQIFNQIGMSEFGILAFNEFPRMASVTMEASYFAQILIPATPYFYWFHQEKKPFIFSNVFNKRMYYFSILSLLIAVTTTGVFGFFMLTALWLINNLRFYSVRSKYFFITIYLVLLFISIYLAVNYLINISETYSGIERFKTVHYGAIYFLDYPILGLGWGVFPTYDLIINLLVNFGLIGTIPFLILLYNIFIKLKVRISAERTLLYQLYRAAIESFLLILIVSQLSGFIYHSQYFWLYLGISISIGCIKQNKELV